MKEEDQALYILKNIVVIFLDRDDTVSRSSRLRSSISDAMDLTGHSVNEDTLSDVFNNLDELALQIISEYVHSQGLLAYSSDIELTDEIGEHSRIRVFATSNEVLIDYIDSAVEVMSESDDVATEKTIGKKEVDPFDIN